MPNISLLKCRKAENAAQASCAAVRLWHLCGRSCWRNKVYILRTDSLKLCSLPRQACAVWNGVESIRTRTYQCLVLITDTTVWLKINLKCYHAEWLCQNISQAWLRLLKSAWSFVFDLNGTKLQPRVHSSNIIQHFLFYSMSFFLSHVICLPVQVVVII